MNYILLGKQDQNFIITKPLNQNPNIKAQTSDEIQPINEYEVNTVVFDDMLQNRKQESNTGLFFTRRLHNINDIYYISQSCFLLPKNTVGIKSNKIIFF